MDRDSKVALGVGGAAVAAVLLFSKAGFGRSNGGNDGGRFGGGGGSTTKPRTPFPGGGGAAQPRSLAELAKLVAANIKAKKKNYERALVAEFQERMGFAKADVDGQYGPQTAEALRQFVDPPPAPLATPAAGWGGNVEAQGKRGANGGLDVSGPERRPASAGEIRRAYKREPTADELESFERWAADHPDQAAAIEARDDAQAAEQDAKGPSGAAEPQRAPAGLLAAAKAAASRAHGRLSVAKASAQVAPSAEGPTDGGMNSDGGGEDEAAPTAARTRPTSSSSTAPRLSPPTPVQLDLARREAPTVAKHLRAKGKAGYSRQTVKAFQAHAGIVPDGIYGPRTRSALVYFGVANPPAPFVSSKETSAYAPPT